MLVIFTYGLLEDKGSDGHGLRALASRIHSQIDTASVLITEWTDKLAQMIRNWRDLGPILLVGHSFGGSALVEAANQMPDIRIDHLVLLDPVPTKGWGLFNFRDFVIPDNVQAATCFWRKPILPPWSCPIRKAGCAYRNIYMNLGHSAFNANPLVQNVIFSIASDLSDTRVAV